MHALGRIVHGAAAGAAGTTALNAVTYLDMATRGRGTSSTPEETVEKLAGKADLTIPGDDDTRSNRLSGLGALNGIVSGIVGGAAVAVVRPPRGARGVAATGVLTGLAVMAMTNGSMVALGVTDPRQWTAGDWIADLVPHLAYGMVTAATLRAMTPA